MCVRNEAVVHRGGFCVEVPGVYDNGGGREVGVAGIPEVIDGGKCRGAVLNVKRSERVLGFRRLNAAPQRGARSCGDGLATVALGWRQCLPWITSVARRRMCWSYVCVGTGMCQFWAKSGLLRPCEDAISGESPHQRRWRCVSACGRMCSTWTRAVNRHVWSVSEFQVEVPSGRSDLNWAPG